ncbi:hypothetical protein [Nonomuraea endophytica]|uniref:Secreted protein n=1 Tax=Nonomuraea endophytica TaxID=714136 RepID=A0A7W8EHR0_9ACTN|nr:hypothetical protein [Nonomuraea endophytica]MBB5081220.1 hypothetical protein [Nonomuraea endophytica]
MTTFRSQIRSARWPAVLAAFWLCAALWSPGHAVWAAEPVAVASAVHLGEECGADEAGPRGTRRPPVKRPRTAAARPFPEVRRAAPATRAAGHAERLVLLSVWRL